MSYTVINYREDRLLVASLAHFKMHMEASYYGHFSEEDTEAYNSIHNSAIERLNRYEGETYS
jgi:hypothetical protein